MANYFSLNRKVNELFKNNKNAKTLKQRNNVVYQHLDLLNQLQQRSEDIDSACGGSDPSNHYQYQINRISNWITNGSDNKPKDYKAKLKPDNPSEIRSNMKTNNRICNGRSNYYKSDSIKPTKSELKDPDIKQLVINLKFCRSLLNRKDKNRWTVSNMIHQYKQDLSEVLNSKRGLNHTGRTDNEPSPIKRQMIDPIDLKNALNNPILRDRYYGYSEQEISNRRHVPQSTVSLRIRTAVKNLVKI